MVVSQETATLVSSLKKYSGEKLLHPDDLASLIELSRVRRLDQVLEDLMFTAKFLVNSSAVMKRIGNDAEGYVQLSREFAENLEKASAYIRLIVKESPEDVKRRFTSQYFGMTPEAMNALTQLLYDLSWLKNWKIDNRTNAQ